MKLVGQMSLPADQQSAVENFLKVNSWPTYKLIDRDGNILEVNANPSHIDSFEKMIKSMKSYIDFANKRKLAK